VNPNFLTHKTQKKFFSQRRQEKQKLESGYHSTYIALISFIAFLLVYYVWTLNTNATKSYEIRRLENITSELKEDLNRLESTISELDSGDTILSDEMIQDMEQSYNPNYLVMREDKQYVYNY
jgi:cell division protein FtsL